MRAKETVDRNRGVEDEREKENKGLSWGKRREKDKGGKVRMGVA